MNLNSFVATYNGKRINIDGQYGAQCYDLVGLYNQKVIGMKGSLPQVLPGNGAAYDVWQSFRNPLSKYFTKVSKGAKAGDIVVWSGRLPGSGGYGHMAVMLSPKSGSFISFDQNWGGAYAHKVSHNYSYVLGYLRPKTKSVSTPSAPPASSVTYTVRPGDNLTAIAARFKTTVGRLVGLNHIKNPNLIYAGQKIKVK